LQSLCGVARRKWRDHGTLYNIIAIDCFDIHQFYTVCSVRRGKINNRKPKKRIKRNQNDELFIGKSISQVERAGREQTTNNSVVAIAAPSSFVLLLVFVEQMSILKHSETQFLWNADTISCASDYNI
jgi:hypothetical protein